MRYGPHLWRLSKPPLFGADPQGPCWVARVTSPPRVPLAAGPQARFSPALAGGSPRGVEAAPQCGNRPQWPFGDAYSPMILISTRLRRRPSNSP